MYGYIIGNMATIIANIDVAKTRFMEKMGEINNYMNTKRIPGDLQKRVRDYYYYLWDIRKGISSVNVMEELPKSLSIEISLFINRLIIEKAALFKKTDEVFVREVVQYLHHIAFLPNDYIIRQGEYGDCMYFLISGEAEVLINGDCAARLSSGSPFGETALLQNEKRMASIRTLTHCEVSKLQREDFNTLRLRHPEFDRQVQEIVKTRIMDTMDKTGPQGK